MAGLIGSFFIGNNITSQNAAIVFQCVVMPLLLLMVVVSVRMTNLWVRQPYPWEAIKDNLKGIGADYTLYNFLLPANHVLIGPTGIFAITSRFQDRPQVLEDDNWKTRANLLTLMRQEQIGNPSRDAQLHAAQTEAFLRELLGDESIEVQPVVVFVHPKASIEMSGEQTVPVLFTDTDRKKGSLKEYLRGLKAEGYPTITKEQIAEIDDALLYLD